MQLEFKNFTIDKCSLIKDEYNLLDFQQYAIYNALNKKSYCLGLPTGSGKSFTSLSTYFYFKEKFPKTKLLIVTETSAILQFNSEIHKFFNYNKETLLIYDTGKGNYKDTRLNNYSKFSDPESENEIIIMNYPILAKDFSNIKICLDNLIKSGHKLFIIYDEASAFKNVSTQNFKSVFAISSLANKILALTATITKGKAEECYGIFKGIGIPLAKTKAKFIEEYCVTKKLRGTYIDIIVGYKNINQLKLKMAEHSIILNKSDLYESLPAFSTKITHVVKDACQKELIKQIKNGKFAKDNLESDQSKSNKITEFGYIKRTLIDPNIVYLESEKLLNYSSPKTLELLHLLNEQYTDEKLVIYANSKRYINILENTISSKCSNSKYKNILKITGDINTAEREDYKKLFTESPDHNIMLINKAGIASINLQISGTIIVLDLPETAGNLIQLLGRISRIGSKHSVLHVNYILTKSSLEEDIYFILNKQLLLLKNILGESEKNIIDFEILKSDNQFKDIPDSDFVNLSIDQILYNKLGREA